MRRPRRLSPRSPSPPAPPSLGVAAPRGRGRCGDAGVWAAGPRNCCCWKPLGRGAGPGAGAATARRGLERAWAERTKGGCRWLGELGPPPPGGQHLLRASPLTPPPLHTLRVPQILISPIPQLSFFRSSARHSAPSSDLKESARASRGRGVFPHVDSTPGGPGLRGRKRKARQRGPWGNRGPGALGPGCRNSGLLRSPGASTTIPDGGKGKPGASCCGWRFVPRPRRAGPGTCEGKASSLQKIPKGAPHDP